MSPRPARLPRGALLAGLAVLLVLATGCGPEPTTATITAIEPLDWDVCTYERFTGDDGIERVDHPHYGCVPVSDIVRITVDIGPIGNGRHHTYVYPYGLGFEGTRRSVVAGLGVGSTFPATYEQHQGFFAVNGPSTSIHIPELDARVRAAMPLGGRTCSGDPIPEEYE